MTTSVSSGAPAFSRGGAERIAVIRVDRRGLLGSDSYAIGTLPYRFTRSLTRTYSSVPRRIRTATLK
jgi:hypothetical protein